MSSPEEAAVATGDLVAARFTVVDYVVFVLMLMASVGIGVYSAIRNRGKESTHNFLLGGGEMSPYPVALSLLGGIFSAISILGEWYVEN
ncbi:Sodium-coupled monocarboxylate transporter 1 [Portunus trituberculatus]|uniref:Sodium-coupled monocarboxylate transporter 1 n=1 Tax=Portunus trituberculatus TaxID=210409 RepID=A0A5B7K4N3_PORTR|nr:Sodium-coupled monocarboxylate transporter 1 [Portunus trituberculatus]